VIQDPSSAAPLRAALDRAQSLALDCEAAGFHRYTDRLCLVQISVDDVDFVLDPLAFDLADTLRSVLVDPEVTVIMHGADYDLRLLDRDLGLSVAGLFDTQVAASLLGEPGLGLSALLDKHLGIALSKKHQRADWAQRPLPPDMIEYATADTAHLGRLAAILHAELLAVGRLDWAREEFRLLEAIRWEEEEPTDPVTRFREARKLGARDLTALRVAVEWRDDVARRRDRAPFRVAADQALMDVARERPRTLAGLQRIKGISRGAVRSAGPALLDRLHAVEGIPEKELQGYPAARRTGPGRPPPEVEEAAAALKEVRNRRAQELGLARGTLMSNATLLEIARRQPRTVRALREVPGVKGWQIDAVADALLTALPDGGGVR
jgi:ribonuclease D